MFYTYFGDNWLLAPSLSALQDMLTTCEEYAASHNLKFSTDPDPDKCKTKLMAFMKKERKLPSLKLCGIDLPWVNKVKHLGNTISNTMDGNQLDMRVKTAKNINMPRITPFCKSFTLPTLRQKPNLIVSTMDTSLGLNSGRLAARSMERWSPPITGQLRSCLTCHGQPTGT